MNNVLIITLICRRTVPSQLDMVKKKFRQTQILVCTIAPRQESMQSQAHPQGIRTQAQEEEARQAPSRQPKNADPKMQMRQNEPKGNNGPTRLEATGQDDQYTHPSEMKTMLDPAGGGISARERWE